jgi:hypothetical protein
MRPTKQQRAVEYVAFLRRWVPDAMTAEQWDVLAEVVRDAAVATEAREKQQSTTQDRSNRP